MDAQLKAKWVEALRSGKYEQARKRLRDGDGFCCLGVLCDVSDAGAWVVDDFNRQQFKLADYEDRRGIMYLPGELKEKFGIPPNADDPLMDMNDKGVSFAEIADYIEANL